MNEFKVYSVHSNLFWTQRHNSIIMFTYKCTSISLSLSRSPSLHLCKCVCLSTSKSCNIAVPSNIVTSVAVPLQPWQL